MGCALSGVQKRPWDQRITPNYQWFHTHRLLSPDLSSDRPSQDHIPAYLLTSHQAAAGSSACSTGKVHASPCLRDQGKLPLASEKEFFIYLPSLTVQHILCWKTHPVCISKWNSLGCQHSGDSTACRSSIGGTMLINIFLNQKFSLPWKYHQNSPRCRRQKPFCSVKKFWIYSQWGLLPLSYYDYFLSFTEQHALGCHLLIPLLETQSLLCTYPCLLFI